ncbi:MAG: carbohydrate kinase [Saprospiraceae bacterium]|nr:carbohydrate kinase [Saprospiraceae bacterium]
MKALAFGEILWDIIDGQPHLGGAPFNVAAHLAQLGNNAFILSAVGNDDLGQQAIHQAAKLGVNPSLIYRLNDYPTGQVDVFLEGGQPDYTIQEEVAWDYIPYAPDQDAAKEAWDTLIFGSLALRTEHNIGALTQVMAHNTFNQVFYDINLRKDYFSGELFEAGFSLCSILKVNDEEVGVVSELLFNSPPDEKLFCQQVSEAYGIDVILITQGAKGALAYSNQHFFQAKAKPIQVADTVGAGDSFSAAFLHTYHRTGNVQRALDNATKMGGFVASRSGAIPTYSHELKTLFS